MARILLSERIRKPPRFMTIEPYLRAQDRPIASHPRARQPRLVPLVVFDYGSVTARLKQLRFIRRSMAGALRELLRGVRGIRRNPYRGQRTIDAATLRDLEDFARSLGATDIGYTRVDPRRIFRGFRILFENAIVFTIEMDREKIRQAPSMPSFVEIFRTYHEVGVVVNRVADFLRERGFDAHPGPAIGGEVSYVPLAVDAGLGYVGKNGLLITRGNGPRVRLAAIYTDIENLPLAGENPFAWIRDYCEDCNICVAKCPADAIHLQTRTHADGGPVFVDHTKCAVPFSNDNGCTLCIKYCPFSYASYDKLRVRHEARHGPESTAGPAA